MLRSIISVANETKTVHLPVHSKNLGLPPSTSESGEKNLLKRTSKFGIAIKICFGHPRIPYGKQQEKCRSKRGEIPLQTGKI